MIAQNRLADLDGILGHLVKTVPPQLIAFYAALQVGKDGFNKADAAALTESFMQSILEIPAQENNS